jgi:NAD(P)-dependent dehydrogenase (short-subunit alcohol dehydrogenase family)
MTATNGSRLLDDKVLFVAGVGPLMGQATARIAAREGARVALVARSAEIVEKTAEEIRAGGGAATALQCDLGREDQLREAVDATVAEFGRIDSVFYNAAYYDHQHSNLEIDHEAWQMTMDVNLMGPMAIARLTLPGMIERGSGSFVFNSSGASLVAEGFRLGYGVSKAGLNALVRFVATKYGRHGIRANGICPAVIPDVVPRELSDKVSTLAALGRTGTAEEIGEAVAFLLSDRSSIITGELIHLDGGMFSKAHWPSME